MLARVGAILGGIFLFILWNGKMAWQIRKLQQTVRHLQAQIDELVNSHSVMQDHLEQVARPQPRMGPDREFPR